MSKNETQGVKVDRLIRAKEIVALTGLSAPTIWRRERAGDFPQRRQISPGAVGWLASEVQAWMDARQCPGKTPVSPRRP
ncbi:MAG: AlpA family phage regulatory protein [Proteobacteria bacterium]|nr:AlpA family phage regulatory protein [Pseudomonadota bacterium]